MTRKGISDNVMKDLLTKKGKSKKTGTLAEIREAVNKAHDRIVGKIPFHDARRRKRKNG